MPPKEDSPLEALQKRVYQQPTANDAAVHEYSQETPKELYGWETPPPAPPPKKHMSWTLRFLIGAGAFLVLAGAAAAFLVFQGTRSISSERVQIEVQPTGSIASGDTVSLVITIHNGNPTALTDATLYATLPSGTLAGDDTGAALTQYSDVLGNMAAGADATRTIQVKLFGTEGQSLSIPIKVEYHTEGSNALFVSQKEYAVTISTSPISIQVQSLSQSPSGQPLTLMVTVRSNASATVQNLALSAQFPQGFTMQGSTPEPSGTNFFTLGSIEPGGVQTIKISGVLIGQNADQRTFRFTAGSTNPDGTNTLGSSFAEGNTSITITHPFLNVGLALNREEVDTVIASPDQTIGAFLTWQNTLTSTLTNASIRIALSGNALAPNSISGGTGFYRSTDGSVIFDGSNTSSLAALSAGDKGAGSFSFVAKPASALTSIQNPTITLSISITGQQATQGSTPQVLNSTLKRTIKIGTIVTIGSTLSHAAGAGPVPPTAGKETLYTVNLSAKNTVNSVGAAKESFQLPSYVRYVGSSDAGISYNPDTRTITWTLGDLSPNASSVAHFQIGFTPSTSQNGSSPVLVGSQNFTGVDRFTGMNISANTPALTSELPGSATSGTVH